jgi:DMSO/TMAO reductase YedYZ molybdopterin-dependent catalytic subunit
MRTRSIKTILSLVLLSLVMAISAAVPALAQSTPVAADATGSIVISGAVNTPGEITVAELQQFPVEDIEVNYLAGGEPQEHTYTGTSLFGVIDSLGLAVPDGTKNPYLATYLIFTASDGYQVIISGGEIDPGFGNHTYYLAWAEDGQALSGDDAPIRLVVPGDVKGGRYVSGVVSIEVVNLTVDASATPVG